MKKALIVDDDPHISELLRLYFNKDGFDVVSCFDGIEAIERFPQAQPDIVILDLMLPGKDGYDVLRDIRRHSNVPVIMLTARGDTLDKVVGLELGADDYVQKPFEPKELMARVKAVLRRAEPDGELQKNPSDQTAGEWVEYPGIRIDKSRYSVTVSGQNLEMPPKELELLFFLSSHPNRVFTREQLLENIWGFDFFGESRTVDVHIKRIREKIEDMGEHPDWQIKTVWGVGYKFEVF
ncbi:MAG: response regulator transcription factor [Eubacteriales bacterium]|nr:response regulator transcription factor [Eubacteriales bacterium]